MARILIIDDDRSVAGMLRDMIMSLGHDVTSAYTAEEGLSFARSTPFDVVFLDVHLPDDNGLLLLPDLCATPSAPEVIIITGYGNPDGAELAIKNGAWDFIEKPLEKKLIELPLKRALQYREAKGEGVVPVALKREGIIGSSPKMTTCLDRLAQAAASDANVIIVGETGTGKEIFAQAIHRNSRRADGSFVTVDCAALPSTIIESVLFGHEKGAFTGADRSREGLVRQADGGTLFLDEVGELPLAAQKAFLRVLQEKAFRPVGSKFEQKSNFRIIAATNRHLDQMAGSGHFRDDLLFRLRSITIELPPLREHREDIRELVFYYTARICERHGVGVKGFSPEFLECLTAYDWPGNIRELIQAMERTLTVAHNEFTLFPKHLPTHIRVKLARASIKEGDQKREKEPSPESKMETLNDFRRKMDRAYLQDLMKHAGKDIEKACRLSGLSRSHLYSLLREHGISKSD